MILLAVIFTACSKNKFETKPKIEVVSQSTDILPPGGAFRVNLEFFDKEGDVTDSIIVVRSRINKKNPVNLGYPLPIPPFPGATNGEFQLDLDYTGYITVAMSPIPIPGSGGKFEPDTLDLKFVLRDKAGNKSDTAQTRLIVIR